MASVANINELGGYTLNPRGNLWFNDESTFGQKMLMKMGWSKGKGLGKNEDGIKENLKVKFECTNGGLGYKDQSYDNVMKGEYESILRNLSAEYSHKKIHKSDDENKNGTQKLKTVKRKIRYPKLFYGKDVSKYSEKDMKSIFLCSLPVHENEEEEVKSNNSVSSCLADSKKELPKLLDSYNSQLTVSDYFSLKMKEKKGNKLKNEPSNEINQDYSNIISNETENTVVSSDKKNKKRKKKLINSNTDLLNLEGSETECENSSSKKRRKISQDLHPENSSDVNNLEMLNSCPSSQSISPSKKRKKSHKLDDISSTNGDTVSNDSDVSLSVLPPPNKKRKKAKSSEFEESVELLSVNAIKQGMSEENNESHKSCLNVSEPQYESSSNNNTNTKKSVKLKNKLKTLKSCLKHKKNKLAFKNVSFNENVSYKIIDSRFEAENETITCIDLEQCDSPTQETSNNYELQKDSNDKTPVQNESCSIENGNDVCSGTVEATCIDNIDCDGNELHSVTDLPSSKSSHYNSWIESQKLALKMKMYKSMLKNIKKHVILKTTNMLSIKGYGNWGFK